jgi:DNA-binding NtrC family response regulator
MRVAIPPLRSRPEDILALYTHFARQARGRAPSLSGKAKELLVGYSWPGNVAELREEAVRLVSSGRARISARQLPDRIREGRGVSRAGAELAGKTLEQVEREMIEGALQSGGGNKAQAARQLGIPRGTFYHLLKRHGL